MRQDVIDVLKGQVIGKPLVSLWRHHPKKDHNPRYLSTSIINSYKKIKHDLIKVSPHGRYAAIDFGCEIKPGSTARGSDGSTKCTNCVIKNPSDWSTLERIDPTDGSMGKQIKMVRGVVDALRRPPIMMTVFSPTMIARQLSAKQFPQHLNDEDYKNDIINAVKIISDISIEFARACIEVGAHGIFAAIQEADKTKIPEDKMDLMLELNENFMKKINKFAEFTVLHLHGEDLAFKNAVDKFKPTAVNWHSETSGPSIEEANKIFDGGLLGGLNPKQVLEREVIDSIQKASQLKNEVPLILSPGCVLLQGTEDKLLAKMVKEYRLLQ